MGKVKVLFVSPKPRRFVERDLEILSKYFHVKSTFYDYKDIKTILFLIPHIIKGTLWADLTFSWFASFHAFFTVLFSKVFSRKSVVVAGGYDAASVSEINYGLMNSKILRFIPILTFRLSDKILAVSSLTKSGVLTYSGVSSRKVGIVYNAFDAKRFKPKGKKEDLVITVAVVRDFCHFKRKGLETFVEASKSLQNIKFALIGHCKDRYTSYLKSIAGPNVEFTGYIHHAKLLRYFQRAKVYVQVSAYESFGCALAEAMLCECVPVVTRRGALPEVVGNVGFYLPYGDPKATAEAMRKALNSRNGKTARERIKNMFPLKDREKELVRAIKRLTLPN